jgi:septal ring factor EnvC (AmiA/AmiB activator)
VAYGQQPNAPPVLAESFGVASAEMPGCGRMRAAVREQVAAECAADAATVAPSEEALAAAREEGRRQGQNEILARLDDYVKRRRSRRDHAITAAAAARKALATAEADEVRLRREVASLDEAFDAIATEEAP